MISGMAKARYSGKEQKKIQLQARYHRRAEELYK